MKNENLTLEQILYRIGYFRNRKNLSAYEVGLQLGHSENYFYRVESGKINISLKTFINTLQVLQVSTSEFFYPDPEKFEEDIKILEKINSLTDEERKSILTFLNIKK